jgi:YgiT-type zinc finger domain-containing protein
MSRSYGSGEAILLVENIPVVKCPDCGESYLEASTLRQIDQLKRERRKVTARRSVPVASLG